MNSDTNAVGAGYFQTLGTSLIRGREIEERDQTSKVHVAVVNEAFVRRFLAGKDPIGKRMESGSGGPLDIQIIGLVKNAQNLDLREIPKPTYYVPLEQAYSHAGAIPSATFFAADRRRHRQRSKRVSELSLRTFDATCPFMTCRR